jgi:uncharacterized membrane protein
MQILSDAPLFILAILCFNIVLSIWLERNTKLKHLGAALLCIILTAITANIGLIPSSTNPSPVYLGIFEYIAPVSIFFLLLGVNLGQLKTAGAPMLLLFCLGTAGTCLGVIVADLILGEHFEDLSSPIAGMITGTYTGGSINFNAVALHYDVMKEGVLYTSIVAADNILTGIWMVVTLSLPAVMQRFIPRKSKVTTSSTIENNHYDESQLSIYNLAILLFLGVIGIFISDYLGEVTKIPSILILTTFALILAQIRFIHQINESRIIGLYLIYLFLAVIGAFCDLAALENAGSIALVVFGYLSIVILIHFVIILLSGWLTNYDWYMVSVASQANIGGSSSALALAKSLSRDDLLLPAVLIGALGNGLGTYLGFLIAGF